MLKRSVVRHRWNVSPKRAIEIQRELAPHVRFEPLRREPRVVAGADLAFSRDKRECIAGFVVWDVETQQALQEVVVRRPVRFPYVPGLLSFREAPALLAAARRLRHEPDVYVFDGQGYAHPRRFGLASHVGVWLDRPSVGCAKSRLCGDDAEPGPRRGELCWLTHRGERIGAILRTQDGVKPVFVSVGHRIDLAGAIAVVLACGTRYRLPEPTRLADKLVARHAARDLPAS